MFYDVLIIWAFNLILLGGNVIALLVVAKTPRARTAMVGGSGLLVTGLIVAIALTQDPFFIMRMMTYLLFAHVPLFLLASAWFIQKNTPRAACLFLALAGALVAVAVDAFWIEPQWLMETHLKIVTTKVEHPIRVAVVADLQTDKFGRYERRALRKVVEARPDIILCAGDYLQIRDPASWDRVCDAINEHLREIDFSAPLGVFAVQGNIDGPRWTRMFDNVKINVMTRTSTHQCGPIQITGLEVMDSFDRNLVVQPARPFHIVLGHAPDFALGDIQADLLIAGHTHGGQICLPGLGPILTASQVPRSWAAGITRLPTGSTLVVSRGIGMERANAPRIRFFCRPEIVLIDLIPAHATTDSLAIAPVNRSAGDRSPSGSRGSAAE